MASSLPAAARASRVVRKSSYGRTQLFLPDPSVVLREVRCMGGITRRSTANVYHTLGDARHAAAGTCCWHCCEPIDDERTVIPLPTVYDSNHHVYHVRGRTCSPGCAKAYVLEHTTFDRGQHLNVLTRMLREVYGVDGPIVETPPRPALRRFGGMFDPRQQPRASCRIVEPPFVSYCMIVEEHSEQPTSSPADVLGRPPPAPVEEEGGLDEPPPPALFDDFLRSRGDAPDPAPSADETRARRKRPIAPPVTTNPSGPMAKFFKPS